MVTIENAVSHINHNTVIKDLSGRTELSASYLLMIVFSCLVALLGLFTNSVAVVIGTMLISPLMGPTFTAALAFTLGDLRLATKALRISLIQKWQEVVQQHQISRCGTRSKVQF